VYMSGVGGHIRHDLEHYSNFLAGLGAGRIDYEARKRDLRVEQNRAFAIERIDETIEQLQQIPADEGTRSLEVKMERGGQEAEWATSTVSRELDFLLSHTVHHFGLVAMILKVQGFLPKEHFGVAPSTVRYLEKTKPVVQA
ncbi:MAG: hypothetical protein AAF492_24785, partial [Verrucomicrobiota bacterium]